MVTPFDRARRSKECRNGLARAHTGVVEPARATAATYPTRDGPEPHDRVPREILEPQPP